MRGNLFSWEFYFPKMRWRPLLLFFLIFLIAGKFASAQCDIEVTISSDGYGDATTWELTDGDGNAVLSGGTYGNGFEDIQQYTAVNPPYTLSITIDDFGWCDNSINYLVTVGGNEDISGTVDAVCNESFTWDFPLTSDLTPCIPSCPAPVSLSATATHNSAHLSWVSDGTLFDIEWGESGFTQGTGTMINDTSDNPYNLIGLDSSTAYQFYVRNDCGGGDLSDWAGPYEFITACEAVSVFPFIETFNADSSTKNCWKVINGNLDGDQWNLNGTGSPRSGMSAQLYTDFNSSNNDYLITPQLDLGTEEKQIKFWVKHRSDSEPDNLRVKVSTSGSEIADFSTDLLYLTTTQITTTYTEYTIDLSSYSGLVYIAFTRVDSPADGWYLYIDDVTVEDIPSCIAPTDLTADNITSESAGLSWTSDGDTFDISWGEGTFDAEEGTIVNGFENGGTLSGLDANTEYQYYVRNDCGGGDLSDWAGPYEFITACEAATIPFFEGFENGFTHDTPIDGCWSQESILGTQTWNANNIFTDRYRTPRTGEWNAFLRYSNTDWLFYPVELEGGTNYLLEFYARQDGSGVTNASVSASYGTSNSSEAMTNTIISSTGIINGEYQLISGIFTPATSGTYYIGINGTINGIPWYISIDDISLDLAPSCIAPTDLTADNITSESADLSWTSDGDTFDISWGEGTFDAEAGTIVNGFENGGTLSGLDSNTTYQYYVRNDCGGGDVSDWAGPYEFTTACTAVSDFDENFDGGPAGSSSNPNLPTCWSFIDSGVGYGYVYNFASPNTSPNHFYIYNNYDASGNYILVSPETVNLGNGENWVRFYAKGSSNGYTLQVGTLSDATNAGTFTVLETISLTSTYTEYFVELPAGTDDYIGFRHGLGGTYRSIYLDNIVFEEAPSCIAPTGLTLGDVDGHTAEFSWSAIDNAEGYNWFVFANDADPESATPVASGNTADTSITVMDLDPETAYDFYVQTDCGSEDGTSELSAKVDFTTTVACPAPTNLSHTQLSMTSAELSWESSGNTFELKWGASGFDIETEGTLVDDLTETSYTLEVLTTDADYEFYVRSDCGAEDGVSVWAGPYSFSVGYCTVNPPSNNDATGITYLGFNTIDNPSDTGTNNTTDHVYYSDFTNISTEVQAGGAYDLSVRLNTSGAYTVWATAWIDWNGDGVFDTVSEAYNLGSVNGETDGPTSNSPLSIQIPMTASGEYRMRVKAAYGETTVPDPCLTQGWSETEDYTINVTGPVTWTGTEWINGTPAEDVSVLINGGLSIENDAPALEVNNMFISGTGSITVESGNTLTVNGKITNENSAASFVVENGGNLIQTNNDVNSGAITVKSESQPMIRLDYTLWSSPVTGQNLFNFSPETVNGVTNYPGSTGRIYIYDGENGYVNPDPFLADTEMNNGTGYLFRSPNNFDASVPSVYNGTFTGIPFNGDLSVATAANNYTSLGNPYPSNLDADLLLAGNPDIGTLYLWVNTALVEGEYVGNNYATYTLVGGTSNTGTTAGAGVPSGIIAVGQGFIVGTSGTAVNFNNSMRTDASTDFFKTTEVERHRFWLSLSNADNYGLNQILVAYMEGATLGVDNQIDGLMFNYNGSAIYSLIEEREFTIQGRGLPFESTDVVPLGFKAEEAGKFIVSLVNFDGLFAEGETTIYLKDKALNITHNLMESDYAFESEAGEFNNRFEVVYSDEGVMGLDELTMNGVMIYKNQNFIEISSKLSKIKTVEIYDLQGRKIFTQDNVNATKHQIDADLFGTQILVVKVTTENGAMANKKMVNK